MVLCRRINKPIESIAALGKRFFIKPFVGRLSKLVAMNKTDVSHCFMSVKKQLFTLFLVEVIQLNASAGINRQLFTSVAGTQVYEMFIRGSG